MRLDHVAVGVARKKRRAGPGSLGLLDPPWPIRSRMEAMKGVFESGEEAGPNRLAREVSRSGTVFRFGRPVKDQTRSDNALASRRGARASGSGS